MVKTAFQKDIVFIIRVNNIGGSEKHTIDWINHLVESGKTVGLIQSGLEFDLCHYGLKNDNTKLSIYKTGLPVRDLSPNDCYGWLRLFRIVRAKQIVWVKPWFFAGHFSFILILRLSYRAVYAIEHSLPPKMKEFPPQKILFIFPRPSIWNFRQRIYRQFMVALIDHIFIVSEAGKKIMLEEKYARHNKITVCPNGINSDFWFRDIKAVHRFRNRLRISDTDYVFGWAGRMVKLKQVDIVIHAVHKLIKNDGLKNCRLILIGDGPERRKLESLVTDLGIENFVHFTGFLKEIRPVFSAIDTLVLPSSTESSPLVLLEAMACGASVIASNTGNIKNVLIKTEMGTVLDTFDPEEWKKEMRKVYNVPIAQKEFISEQIVRHIRKYHDQKDQMMKFDEIFNLL